MPSSQTADDAAPAAAEAVNERVSVRHLLAGASLQDVFATDVRHGLTAEPKFLRPRYFYDELGSHLFEAICQLPEYYPTRAERQILVEQGDDIAAALPLPVVAVELGSGSAAKTRHLLAAILRRQKRLTFVPVDIAGGVLERSAHELVETYPGLAVHAIVSDFEAALDALGENLPGRAADHRLLLMFLGSTIGNLAPPDARVLVGRMRGMLSADDVLLLGTDLKKNPAALIAAYDDALGVTAAFDKNVLLRINRELGGDFDLDRFAHRARWNAEEGRMEMHLESLEPQTVHIRDLDLEISFATGETIHTENSYKFDREQIEDLAAATGFVLDRTFHDRRRRFGVHLLRAR